MNPYPGAAPLVVATSGGGSGVLVTSGVLDPHGWWPMPLVAQGNDPRSAAYMFAAVESVTDRSNWLGWRAADWIFGGDYRALFTGTVIMGGILAYVGASAGIVIAGTSKIYIGGGILGPGGLEVESGSTAEFKSGSVTTFDGGSEVDAFANTTTGFNVTATTGNVTAGTFAGHGSGWGIRALPGGTSGTAAVYAQGGPVLVDTNISASSATGPSYMWANQIVKATASITFNGSGGVAVDDNVNVSTVTLSGGNVATVNFAQAMTNTHYSIVYGCSTVGTANTTPQTISGSRAIGTFNFNVITDGSIMDLNGGGAAVIVDLIVIGRQ